MGPWWSLSYFQTPLSDGLWPRNVSQINPSSLKLLLVRVLYPSNRTLGIEHFLKWMSSNIAFLSRPYIILDKLLLKEQKAISGWSWHTATVQYATVCCVPTNRIQMLCKLKSTRHIQLLHGSEHMPWASQAHLASNYFWDLAEKSSSGAFSHGLSDSTHCDTEQVKWK